MRADPRLGASADPPSAEAPDYPAPAPDYPAPGYAEPAGGGWTTLVSGTERRVRSVDEPVRLRRLVIQLGAAGLAVIALVAIAGALVSRRTAASESVHEAAQLADVLADSVVQPVLTDAIADDPAAAKAVLEPVVRARVLSGSLVRVKIWTPQGRILYSDEPRLIGMSFPLDDAAQAVFATPQTRAEVSDLRLPENQFERSRSKLLEVYRPVWTPNGSPLLFETYFRYDVVSARSSQLWRGFMGITLSSLGAILLLLLPLVWALLAKARRAQRHREALIQRALDASREERRRIAATLHDGPVQELAAASFAVAGGAKAAAAAGDPALAAGLDSAAGAVRTSMSGLRSLLVDIYPPALRSAGLPAALRDLVATLSGRGPTVQLDIDDAAAEAIAADDQETVFRIAQELLRNVVSHARAGYCAVTLTRAEDEVVLAVSDDGVGFDPARTPPEDHFGLRVVRDLAGSVGAELRVRSAPGAGTSWRLSVPA